MSVGSTIRVVLARRPWLYWGLVLVIACGIGLGVRSRLHEVDRARDRWRDTRQVLVASDDHDAGDAVVARSMTLPAVAIPPSALRELPDGAIARQRVAVGEMLVATDVAVGPGPAAGADDGTVVVPISDPLVVQAPVGVTVAVYAEGLVLSAAATIVHVDGDVLFVSVDPADAPLVAAAAQRRTASVVFTR